MRSPEQEPLIRQDNGPTRWMWRCPIHNLLAPFADGDGVSDADAKAVARAFARRLRKLVKVGGPVYPRLGDMETAISSQEEFNDLLDDLYDWADLHWVWTGR